MYRRNINNGFIGGLLIIIGAILCLLLVGYIAQRLDDSYFTGGINNYQGEPASNTTTTTTTTTTEPEVNTVCGIVVENPSENETTFSPLSVTGYVKGCGWDPIDGDIGTVALFDGTTGQMLSQEVDISILTTTGTGNINFSAILSYPDTTSSLSGFLYFKHAAGGETFSLPIKY